MWCYSKYNLAFSTDHLYSNGNGSTDGSMSHKLKTNCKQGLLTLALDNLYCMDCRAILPDFYVYSALLEGSINAKALPQGKLVHAHMLQLGFKTDGFLETKLLIMYIKCRNLEDARDVFEKMPQRNVVSWNAIIGAYARSAHCVKAITLFYQMGEAGIKPDGFTFASVLPACAKLSSLNHGRKIHAGIIRNGLKSDIVVENALIDMYVKCGSIEGARNVFDDMPELNVVSWSAMIAGYAQGGCFDEALKLFEQMHLAGVKPDSFTFVGVLPVCTTFAALEQGKEVHGAIVRSGFDSNIFVGNALLDMYVKCGSIGDARKVFDKIPVKNVISWTSMVVGYVQNGCVNEALELFRKMPERNVVSWTAMVAGYAQIGCVDKALNLFNKMPERNVVSWTAMISGYTQNGKFHEALKFFREMRLTGVEPNSDTFASLLPACANMAAIHEGKALHQCIIRSGFLCDVYVGNALIDMYAKCGNIEGADKVFQNMHLRDAVSWNTTIAGHAQSGLVDKALKLFQKMPDKNVVSWNVIITGLSQEGHVDEAQKLFQEMPQCNMVSWTAMISGYAQNGYFDEALSLFGEMQLLGLKPSSATFTTVLSACANLATFFQGKEVHGLIIRSEYQEDIFVGNALIDMYAKCGSIDDAYAVFRKMPTRDVVSWNAIILGNAIHGCANKALKLFQQMQHSSTKPDQITFIGVLSACCHVGLVDDGRYYFACMSHEYQITPAAEHYCCMVDLLGRAGLLHEAQDFITNMPIKPDAAVWGSLFSACRIHNNTYLGECVAKCLFESDNKHAAHYVLLSNMYAAAGRWDDVERVREAMKQEGLEKMPGCSWIEINNKMYAFLVEDKSNLQTQ
ncbi:hypothetical protein KI387_020435 [Taxus chinensis]|uniref:Uncharacterized protein n=1 Tax=Taxus chinensis TaxID=29808 RepID=A0AA38LC92_TAXCH|nr:hypothetical protein KI387_020435 [Taxus chinensis]